MLQNPTCPIMCTTTTQLKKCVSCSDTRKLNNLIEPDFPENFHGGYNKRQCPPKCKGVYTWISSPKAMHSNTRKLMKHPQEYVKQFSIILLIFYIATKSKTFCSGVGVIIVDTIFIVS